MKNLFWGIENVSFFDSHWAFVHFCSNILLGIGLIMALQKAFSTKKYFLLGLTAMIIWELFELTLRYFDRYQPEIALSIQKVIPKSFFLVESPLNILSDLVLGFLGLLIVYSIWKVYKRKCE